MKPCLKNDKELERWLSVGALVSLTEDPDSVPSTHIVGNNQDNPSFRESDALARSLEAGHT